MNDTKLPEIRTALKQLINTMASAEKGSVIGYKLQTAEVLSGLSSNKKTLMVAIDQLSKDKSEMVKRLC